MIRRTLLTASAVAMLTVPACTTNTEEKNYKVLEEDRPLFETEHKPTSRNDAQIERHFAALDESPMQKVEVTEPGVAEPRQPVIPMTFEDRSKWEVVTIGPADGRTTHYPVYFHDCPIGLQRTEPINPEAAFEQYLAHDTNAGWNGPNAAAFAAQPIKFFYDLVAWPVHAVITPPWTQQTTP